MSNGQLRCSKVDELKLCVCSNTGTRFTILKVSGRSWHLCLGVLYVMADGCAADDSGQKVTHSHWAGFRCDPGNIYTSIVQIIEIPRFGFRQESSVVQYKCVTFALGISCGPWQM